MEMRQDHTGEAQHELEHTVHSTATLLKASLFATVLAIIVLVVAILPSEYGIDPTGIGHAIGLTQLSDTASSSVPTSKPLNQDNKSQGVTNREDSAEITVPPGKGLEYKFFLVKDHKLNYAWSTNGGELFFDFHGEPEGDTTGYFESYTISESNEVRGVLTAPFTGSHGWYWENRNTSPVIISLLSEGQYKVIGIK